MYKRRMCKRMVQWMLDSQKDELYLIISTRGNKAKLFIILASFAAKGGNHMTQYGPLWCKHKFLSWDSGKAFKRTQSVRMIHQLQIHLFFLVKIGVEYLGFRNNIWVNVTHKEWQRRSWSWGLLPFTAYLQPSY